MNKVLKRLVGGGLLCFSAGKVGLMRGGMVDGRFGCLGILGHGFHLGDKGCSRCHYIGKALPVYWQDFATIVATGAGYGCRVTGKLTVRIRITDTRFKMKP